MGTLASGLGPLARALSGAPRVYVDANMPAGLVSLMRQELGWDVLFVIEGDDLRRASDEEHFRRAFDYARTLVTLDRDYLDDRAFPPEQSGGVLVISAPNERELSLLLSRVDRALFARSGDDPPTLPLAGRKLHAHTDWGRRDSAVPDGRP